MMACRTVACGSGWLFSAAMAGLVLAIVGCAGSGSKKIGATTATQNRTAGVALRIGDPVRISFSGNATPPQDVEERIKEDGTINLPLVGSLTAEGKSAGQLQKEIQDLYVPKYFQRLTVTVKTENRVFYVDGEVKHPDRFIYQGEITVLQAIAAAQGFNEFAGRGRVELTRSTGEKLKIYYRKARDNPSLDLPVFPGDRISVPRRSPFGK